MATRNADNLRRLREAAVANGMCQGCRCRPRTATSKSCKVCLDRRDAHRKATRGVLCARCSKRLRGARRGMAYCRRCGAIKWARKLAKMQRYLERGVCGGCGREPLVAGRTMGARCLDRHAERQLARSRSLGVGIKPFSCATCTAMGLPSMNHDARTHDRYMAKAMMWASEEGY